MIESAKKHGVAAVVAAAVAAGTSASMPQKPPVQVTHQVNASKHAWPDLTDPQKARLSAALAARKGASLSILTSDASAVDLAQDIDDACEDAGVTSQITSAALPIGYGFYVAAEQGNDDLAAAARDVAVAIALATDGALKPDVRIDAQKGAGLFIAIGKKPR